MLLLGHNRISRSRSSHQCQKICRSDKPSFWLIQHLNISTSMGGKRPVMLGINEQKMCWVIVEKLKSWQKCWVILTSTLTSKKCCVILGDILRQRKVVLDGKFWTKSDVIRKKMCSTSRKNVLSHLDIFDIDILPEPSTGGESRNSHNSQ